MHEEKLIGLGLAAFGILPMLPAIFNWDWFFNLPKSKQGLLGSLGRQAQRVLYGIIGGACIVLGLLIATGIVSLI